MRMIVLLVVLVCTSAAHATCGDTYYNNVRSSRIDAIVSGAPPGAAYVLGDSFLERAEVTFQQGTQSSGGKSTFILGSAGGTIATLANCFPWAFLNSPSVIAIQIGLNDANNGTCCTGSGESTGGGPFATAFDALLTAIRSAHPGAIVVLISDPPAEFAAGIDAYRVFQTARVIYYLANHIIGTQGTTFTFVDNYHALRGAACTPASSSYATPCYQAAGATLDEVHSGYANTQAMIGNILASF